MKKWMKILGAATGGLAVGVGLYKHYMPTISPREYTEKCLHLAYLDDCICRCELPSKEQTGEKKEIVDGHQDLINYRYSLFLNLYKNHTKEEMDKEIVSFQKRLVQAEQIAETEQPIETEEIIEIINIIET